MAKAVPAEVKGAHAAALTALKGQLGTMKQLLPGHVARIEQLFTSDRAISCANWISDSVDHGLVGWVARPLVWRFGDASGVWFDGQVVG